MLWFPHAYVKSNKSSKPLMLIYFIWVLKQNEKIMKYTLGRSICYLREKQDSVNIRDY